MRSRKTIKFSERFHKRWMGYAAAAGAAGAGLLASTQPARADIIYTPADIQLDGSDGRVSLASIAFDNGRDYDVFFVNRGHITYCSWCVGKGESFGDAQASVISSGRALNAGPLLKGFQIGPTGSSPRYATLMGWLSRRVRTSFGTRQSIASDGLWAGEAGYLGVKFALDGQIHYGWIAAEGSGTTFDILGWAYNTIPNAPIDAGQGATPEPGTLGLLALGSLGLGLWRRRKVVGGQQKAAGRTRGNPPS
jgi:hypothetical protein